MSGKSRGDMSRYSNTHTQLKRDSIPDNKTRRDAQLKITQLAIDIEMDINELRDILNMLGIGPNER